MLCRYATLHLFEAGNVWKVSNRFCEEIHGWRTHKKVTLKTSPQVSLESSARLQKNASKSLNHQLIFAEFTLW